MRNRVKVNKAAVSVTVTLTPEEAKAISEVGNHDFRLSRLRRALRWPLRWAGVDTK